MVNTDTTHKKLNNHISGSLSEIHITETVDRRPGSRLSVYVRYFISLSSESLIWLTSSFFDHRKHLLPLQIERNLNPNVLSFYANPTMSYCRSISMRIQGIFCISCSTFNNLYLFFAKPSFSKFSLLKLINFRKLSVATNTKPTMHAMEPCLNFCQTLLTH